MVSFLLSYNLTRLLLSHPIEPVLILDIVEQRHHERHSHVKQNVEGINHHILQVKHHSVLRSLSVYHTSRTSFHDQVDQVTDVVAPGQKDN